MSVNAFAYLRVSGKAQCDGDGFDRQLLACETYAKQHDYQITYVFREEGVSGTKELENRPALQELFASLEENGTKTVLIEKLDRLARDLMVQETILTDMRKSGYTLISALEPDLCSEDPSRKMVRQIFGAIAEYERAMIVLKLRGARQRMKSKTGRCEGQKPYGTTPEESLTLARIHDLRAQGDTTGRIAHKLACEGIVARSGRPWHASSIAKILARTPQTPTCA